MRRALTVWTIATMLPTLAAGCRQEPSPVASPPSAAAVAADPLPSWNDGAAKKSIVDFVGRVTREGGAGLRAAA